MRAVLALAWLPAMVVGLRKRADGTSAVDENVHANGTVSSQSIIGDDTAIELGAGVVLRERYVLQQRITEQYGPGKVFPKLLKHQFGKAKHLGTGSFGDTWKAHDSHLGKDVAVKIFYDYETDQYLNWLTASPGQKAELRENALECSMVQEMMKSSSKYPPGASRICQCYEEHVMDARDTIKPVFLVMEMCGGSLADVLKKMAKKKKTKVAQARYFIKQAIEGIAFIGMMSPPLIHHDLKPANLVVDGYNLKIIDWGAATVADPELGGAVYTPVYAAPEVLASPGGYLNFQKPAHSYDVYALGLIYIELLCPRVDPRLWYNVITDRQRKLQPNNITELMEPCPELAKDPSIEDDVRLIAKMVSWSPEARPAPLNLLASPPLSTAVEPPPKKKAWYAGLR